MSKLYHETPREYIVYCRDAIRSQKEFIKALSHRKGRHLSESDITNHDECNLCKTIDDCVDNQQELLADFNERYQRARKGLYE